MQATGSVAGQNSNIVLTITVTNLDDEAPVFAETALTAQVAGGATAGTEVIDIDATDDEAVGSDNAISYGFFDGTDVVQTINDFTINANTGVITVATVPAFVGGAGDMRTLTIRATDTDAATGTISAPEYDAHHYHYSARSR